MPGPEVTDISEVKFEIVKDTEPAAIAVPPAPVDPNPTPATDPAAKVDAPVDPAKVTDPAKAPATPVNTDIPPVPQEPQDLHLEPEEFNDLVSDASNGKIKSLEELNEIVEWREKIQADPSLLLKDEHQKKIFQFLTKYQQDDYSQGIQTFAKLQQLDLEKLTPESALEELYILKNAKMGISKEDAKAMFKHEFEENYESKGEIGQTFLKRDGYQAKLELDQMKKEVNVPKVESQVEHQAAQARQNYLSHVEKSFENEQGQFKDLKISFSDNSEEDYTYPVPETANIKNAIANYGDFFQQRYGDDQKGYDMEQMKLDMVAIHHMPDMLQKAYEHGFGIGKETAIRERNNVSLKGEPQTNARQDGVPQSLEQSIMDGIKNRI